jgi:tetratricopeptide (TPR) repeat protein
MRRASFVIPLLIALGCAGAASPRPTIAPPPSPPAVVTETTYADALRHFWLRTPDDPTREALRKRLVEHLLAKAPELITAGEYEAVIEHLATVTQLYTPAEIADGKLPAGLEPIAHFLVERGSPRGDEARVLSGLLVLRGIHGTAPALRGRAHARDPAPAQQYRRVRDWGFDARSALGSPLERFEEGIVEVWEEHARLTPTPKVLSTLARLYVERRNALIAMFQSNERRMPLSAEVFEGVQRTAMSVAAIYLRHGDIASAMSQLQAMGASGGLEEKLIEILETAREEGNEGSGALLDLARHYLEDGQPDVSRALCVVGLRAQREDARFPQCLARIAATQNDFAGAMAWYAEAVRLMPEERGLYDEILEVLSSLMEQGLFGSDPSQTRTIAKRAAEILEERTRRWPDSPPAVKPEELYLAIAIAEMNAGNAPEAEARLRKSLEARETVGALMQLGLLLERVGRGPEAAELYRRALNIVGSEKNGSEKNDAEPRRAEILERLGDALRMQGRPQEATQMYEQGLALWDENLSRQKGQRIGLAHLRRGVLLGRLARRSDSVNAFERAMELAPEMRETYATILAYLAVSEPDSRFAHRVFRAALNQLSLEPEWKVYFALWLRMIASRGNAPVESDVSEILADLGEGDDWSAKLAQYASGKLAFETLMESATDVGERTEATFYEGARRFATGDLDGARQMFQRVLDSNMVNFYEYAMAQELIARTHGAVPGAGSNPPARAQSPSKTP